MYQKMYTTLFNAITKALEDLDQNNIGLAKECLIAAQRRTEDIFMEGQDGCEAKTPV